MTLWRVILRGILHHRRTHAAVVGGAATATAVLVGALLIGASVRYTQAEQARLRIGGIRHALVGGDRFFGADLGVRLGDPLAGGHAAMIVLPGVAIHPGSSQQAGSVQVLGVEPGFWSMSPGGKAVELAPDQVGVNVELAGGLGVRAGDEIVLRIDRPGAMPRDAALGGGEEPVILRATIGAVVEDASFGRFALSAEPRPALNAFVPLDTLARLIGQPGKANLLITQHDWSDDDLRAQDTSHAMQLADYQLALRPAVDGQLELTSDRVFLDAPVASVADEAANDVTLALTYFVNALSHGDRTTPYSTVAALRSPDPLLEGIGDDEIIINDWLAEDLAVGVGDMLALRYFVVDASNRLAEREATFRVARVTAMTGMASDATLMPAFPGLHDAENCRDWEPGIPVDLDRIREKDEAYWDSHRGTPKAFITLRAGQRLWANRFGDLTAIRFPGPRDQESLARDIIAQISPTEVGLRLVDVRGAALAAAGQGTDFTSLFLGLSGFLIASALLLTSLLFAFSLEQRAGDIGLMLAVGWSPGRVRMVMMGEALVLAAAGAAAGAGLGVGFTRVVLRMLATIWQGAVSGASISMAPPGRSAVTGAALGAMVTLCALAWTTRRLLQLPAARLLAGDTGELPGDRTSGRSTVAKGVIAAGVVGAAAMLAMGRLGGLGAGGQAASNAFFAAGGLLLLAGVAGTSIILTRGGGDDEAISMTRLAWRTASRRRGRSLTVAGLMASALFLVLAVGATQLQVPADPRDRASGTGGFAFYGTVSLPLLDDPRSDAGREALGLDDPSLERVRVVPLRIGRGDDASCLSLTRAQQPRLIGVNAETLTEREAFTFVAGAGSWRALAAGDDDDASVIPGVADRNTLMWGLHASVGDLIRYVDERGREFHVRIVAAIDNSILQGGVIIAEEAFVERYPSTAGWGAVLVDVPINESDEAATALASAMGDMGLDLTPAGERLALFNAVENTYRQVFQALGAAGLLLGCVAVGAVVLRNVLERRGELALLEAVGFTRPRLRRLLVLEHAMVVGLGLGLGTLTAGVAAAGHGILTTTAALIVAAVATAAFIWIALASWLALRGPLLDNLRSE